MGKLLDFWRKIERFAQFWFEPVFSRPLPSWPAKPVLGPRAVVVLLLGLDQNVVLGPRAVVVLPLGLDENVVLGRRSRVVKKWTGPGIFISFLALRWQELLRKTAGREFSQSQIAVKVRAPESVTFSRAAAKIKAGAHAHAQT